ncbi:hypothetical protein RchiOBHm_Chr1g0372851 [Rosa chinensis]|uniref:Uncharacterized protein n=1 Tax=Rosa chinensis TaxID=74649 RepID=A0A2P6SLY7_ROSCH|nr:hypothetical protein RchiOBHm_Chr1g0372851 [Rosa chinensis]
MIERMEALGLYTTMAKEACAQRYLPLDCHFEPINIFSLFVHLHHKFLPSLYTFILPFHGSW